MAEPNGAFVMGCNSPRATPRAISISMSLQSEVYFKGYTLQCRQVFHLAVADLVHSTLPNALSQDKTLFDA